MEIIPAIDLLSGNCVRLKRGDYDQVTKFNMNPLSQALEWQSKGATRLHLVDLDGAKTGKPINDKSIKEITKELDIPIQIGGGIRTEERVDELINFGLTNIILGTIAIEKPDLVEKLAYKYPNKIIIGIDAKEGKVATRGWLKQSNILAADLSKILSKLPIKSIIYTDIETDGTLVGPNLNSLREISESSNVPVIASGGIGSISDLISLIPLEQIGVKGVIVGRAIYDNKIDLEEAILSMENRSIIDNISGCNFIA